MPDFNSNQFVLVCVLVGGRAELDWDFGLDLDCDKNNPKFCIVDLYFSRF